MLITHVQFYPTDAGRLHVQATGPAFPTGYASGDVSGIDPSTVQAIRARVEVERQGSMRIGSDAQYAVGAIDGETVTLKAGGLEVMLVSTLVAVLNAPQPRYELNAAEAVSTLVRKRVQEAATRTAGSGSADGSEEEEFFIDDETIAGLASDIASRFSLNSEAQDAIRELLRDALPTAEE